MVRCVVECVKLLTTSVFVLDFTWCTVETGSERTLGMIALSWWGGVG